MFMFLFCFVFNSWSDGTWYMMNYQGPRFSKTSLQSYWKKKITYILDGQGWVNLKYITFTTQIDGASTIRNVFTLIL